MGNVLNRYYLKKKFLIYSRRVDLKKLRKQKNMIYQFRIKFIVKRRKFTTLLKERNWISFSNLRIFFYFRVKIRRGTRKNAENGIKINNQNPSIYSEVLYDMSSSIRKQFCTPLSAIDFGCHSVRTNTACNYSYLYYYID